MSSIKNVLIIGVGLAGAPAAAELAKTLPASHRLIALSENDFAYYPIASLRAAVVSAVIPYMHSPLTLPWRSGRGLGAQDNSFGRKNIFDRRKACHLAWNKRRPAQARSCDPKQGIRRFRSIGI